MTVDIFGSDNKTIINKSYKLQLDSLQIDINSKFTTLTKNLQTKLDKNVVCDLDMNGYKVTNAIDPLKDTDVANKNYVDKLNDKISSKIDADDGELLGDLRANSHKICHVANPSENGDVANKGYVDLMYMQQTDACKKRILEAALFSSKRQYILSTIGLIPQLFNNKDKTGYIVTASSELNEHSAGYKIFNPRNSMWRANANVTDDFWISIQCIKPTSVYMFTITPADKTTLIRWKIQGKNLKTDWIDLRFNTNPISSFTRFETDPKFVEPYENYRLYIREAESENNNPGISHWQLFTIDYLQMTEY